MENEDSTLAIKIVCLLFRLFASVLFLKRTNAATVDQMVHGSWMFKETNKDYCDSKPSQVSKPLDERFAPFAIFDRSLQD